MYLEKQKYLGDVGNVENNGSGLIKITLAGHGLSTGKAVIIQDVEGTTEANGVWLITVVDANSFTLDGSTFSNAYVQGGTIARGDAIRIDFAGTLTTGQTVLATCAYRDDNGAFARFAPTLKSISSGTIATVIFSDPTYHTQVEVLTVVSNESSNVITFDMKLMNRDGLELPIARASLAAGDQWNRDAKGKPNKANSLGEELASATA